MPFRYLANAAAAASRSALLASGMTRRMKAGICGFGSCSLLMWMEHRFIPADIGETMPCLSVELPCLTGHRRNLPDRHTTTSAAAEGPTIR